MPLPTFLVGKTVKASELQAIVDAFPVKAVKLTDQSVNNAVRANTDYHVDLALMATQAAAGTGIDLKAAWTFPAGCALDLAVVGPHSAWVATAGAALEVEWAAWQGVTSSPSGTVSFGTLNGVVFSYHVKGTLRVGANAGTFRFQWAQNTSNASDLTVKAGSSLILTPLP
jgi:hypothetical protein